MFKRIFDIFICLIAAFILAIPAIVVAIAVRLTSPGPILYWSDRIGSRNRIFSMPKFRSMKVNTPVKATHLLKDSKAHLTSIGGFLRKSSLDEIPQLWSVLRGDMSFVGPRPALFNQYDLIALRTEKNINSLLPGITGLAQISGRDQLSIEEKVSLDEKYYQDKSLLLDIKILLLTVLKVMKSENISH